MKFVLATNNEHKILEIKRILQPFGINVISAKEANLDLSEIEETGLTFEENARIKAIAAATSCGMAVIGDDSGLMVDALDGRPGIYSSRYAGGNSTNDEKNAKILYELRNVKDENRGAKFVTALCCILPNKKEIIVRGECRGKIAFEPIGENGFYYDPIFISETGKTFAQLSAEEKDKISHRGIALRKLTKELEKNLI